MGFIETNKKNEDLKVPVCSVGVQNILQMLHLHSEEEAYKVSKDFKIFNSAIEQYGHELKFAGAGKHVLVFTPLKEGWKPRDLENVAETYVYNFTGQKINISFLQFRPIQRPMTPSEISKAAKAKIAESVEEKNACFTLDANQLCTTAEVKNSLMQLLFEASVSSNKPFKSKMTDFDKDLAEQNKEKVTGYFIRFNVITGEYEKKTQPSSIQKAWSSVINAAKQTLDGVSISKFDWKSGSEGQKHYLGNFINSILGKIDAEKLRSSVSDELQKNHRGIMAHIDVMNSIELANFLRKRLTRDEADKIQKTDYTLGIKISKVEKGYEQINVPYIADVVNNSIEKSLLNKMTGVNDISEDDVILVNHYNDNLRDEYANKYNRTYHDYSMNELNEIHTPEYLHNEAKLAKILMFKYYKNRIDAYKKCKPSYDVQGGQYNFSKPLSSDLARIVNASYSTSLSNIYDMIDLNNQDFNVIENQITYNPSDLSNALIRWTYKPGTTLTKALSSLTDPTSADALSTVARAFNIPLARVITSHGNDINPIVQKYNGDTVTNEVISAVNSLIDSMKTDTQQQSDIKYNEEKAKSHRTEYDVYLVPLENLVVKGSSPKTRPDLEQK